jgi:hypothetical protein
LPVCSFVCPRSPLPDLSQRNNFAIVNPETDFSTLLRVLKKHYRGVVLEGDKLVNYITRSDVLKYVFEKNLVTDEINKKTIEVLLKSRVRYSQKKELGIGTSGEQVVTILPSEKVVEGFKVTLFSQKILTSAETRQE